MTEETPIEETVEQKCPRLWPVYLLLVGILISVGFLAVDTLLGEEDGEVSSLVADTFIGSCYELKPGAYSVSITAFDDGAERTVIEAHLSEDALQSRTQEVLYHYGVESLGFGDASSDCSHIIGWW